VALSLCPLLSRQLIVCNPTPRYTPERLSEPIRVLTLSLVGPGSLLVLKPPSLLLAGGSERGGCSSNSLPSSRSPCLVSLLCIAVYGPLGAVRVRLS
jgi:hypothetical protein